MHTLFDLRGSLPFFIHVSDGMLSDVKVLDDSISGTGAFYVLDRGYLDFYRLYRFTVEAAFFVVRTKCNVLLRRRYSLPFAPVTGAISDQRVLLDTIASTTNYPDPPQHIHYLDAITQKRLVFLTNKFALPPLAIANIYRSCWQVELFFKWIKQHLRIKSFFGTTENAVKTQIWIAVSVYVLVAIVRKRLPIKASLYSLLQVLSLTLFEKKPILQAFQAIDSHDDLEDPAKQWILFDL